VGQKGLSPIIIILFLATLVVAGIYFYKPIVLDNILASIIEKIEPTTPSPTKAISPTTKPKKSTPPTPTSQPESTSLSTPTPAPTSIPTNPAESSPTPSPSPTENNKPGKKDDVPFVGG
jgi:hypothetical protein